MKLPNRHIVDREHTRPLFRTVVRCHRLACWFGNENLPGYLLSDPNPCPLTEATTIPADRSKSIRSVRKDESTPICGRSELEMALASPKPHQNWRGRVRYSTQKWWGRVKRTISPNRPHSTFYPTIFAPACVDFRVFTFLYVHS